VALAYHRHIERKIPLDPSVIQYNEDDVKVLPYLINVLCTRRHYMQLEREQAQKV
jgi:hypothetical protein